MARGRPSRATIYARLDSAIGELNDRLGGLPSPKESEYVWSDIWHLEAHHSTALEGNTLVLREVEVLLARVVPWARSLCGSTWKSRGTATRPAGSTPMRSTRGTGVPKDLSRCTRSARSTRSR